jgi:hypothetical protein
MRSLALGLVLTLAAMFVILPYQGHGWGYRYFHGLLGSICLIAAFSWGRLTEGLAAIEKRAATLAFGVAAAVSLLVLAPVRAWQANRFARPYVAAERAIERAKSQIVFVDANGVEFGQDFVRNDPYFRNRPIVLYLGSLGQSQMRELCSRYSLSLFDRTSATAFGVPTFARSESEDSDPPGELRAACPRVAAIPTG